MSTLKVNDILEATTGGGKIFPARGKIKFNASTSTITINDDENVSSITDDGVGYYRINHSNSYSNAHYCAAGLADSVGVYGGGDLSHRSLYGTGAGNPTTSVCPIGAANWGGSAWADCANNSIIFV